MKKIKNERKRNWGLWATEQRSTTSAGKNRDAKVDPRIPTGVSKYTLFVSFSARYMTLCNLDAGGTRWWCHHINVKKLSSLCVSRAAPALELFSFFSVSGNWLLPWIRPHLLSFLLQPPSKHVHAEAAGVAALQTLRSAALVLSLNAPLKPQRLRPLMPHPRRQIKLFGTPACTCGLSFGTLCFPLCLGPLLWCVNLLGQHIIIQFSRKKKKMIYCVQNKMFPRCCRKRVLFTGFTMTQTSKHILPLWQTFLFCHIKKNLKCSLGTASFSSMSLKVWRQHRHKGFYQMNAYLLFIRIQLKKQHIADIFTPHIPSCTVYWQ